MKKFLHGTHPDQRIAKIGLALQLLIIQTDQFLANFVSRDGTDGGISKNCNEQLRSDGCENDGKANEIDRRCDDIQKQIQGLIGKCSYVLRDTLIRIVNLPSSFQRVIHSIAIIQIHRPSGHPIAPFDTQSLGLESVKNGDGSHDHESQHELNDDLVESILVFFL